MLGVLTDTLQGLVPRPVPTAIGLRQNASAVALSRLVQVRAYLAPVLSALALTFAFFEPTPWRRVLLAGVVVTLLSLTYIEWARSKRYGVGAVNVPFNISVVLGGQLALICATGGLFSPVLPAVLLLALLTAILSDRGLLIVAGAAVPAFWVMAYVHSTHGLVPELFGQNNEFESGLAPWIAASLYSFMFVMAGVVGSFVRGVLGGLFTDALDERDQRLAMHAEQTRALSALSAEIAHELKNPLSSVKGLGALVAKDVDGKPAERIAVLRREVDRMQTILEELLNFSRPLVPLSMERIEARALADDVVRLHEGMAVDHGVTLRVDADDTELTCDPRKVRQILINIVQNALHASPPGSAVEISVRRLRDSSEEEVQFVVEDRGEGVPDDLLDRVFEAGVTGKSDGSGIGLVVARSLARQHDGELELVTRDGGGCRAVLTLPLSPPEEQPS